MSDHGRELLKQFKELESKRAQLEKTWRDCYEYTYPLRGEGLYQQYEIDGTIRANSASGKHAEHFDSTARDSVRLLASSVLAGLTPANSKWFDLQAPENPLAPVPQDVKRWLQEAAASVFHLIHSSNYDSEAYEFMLDIVIGGQAGLYIELNDAKDGFRFETWPLYSLYVTSTNGYGMIDTVHRICSVNIQEAVSKFGLEKLPEHLKEAFKQEPHSDKLHAFVHVIRPRKNKKGGKLKTNMPFESTYVCKCCGTVVAESGYEEFPVVIPRWTTIPDTDYAVGPLYEAISDVKTLDRVWEMTLSNAELKIGPMMLATDDGVINPKTVRIRPREIIRVADPESLKVLNSGGDMQTAEFLINRLQQQVRQVMMADQLAPLDRPNMTATEVQIRTQLVRQILGPIFNRLQAEFLNPLINRCFYLAFRSGFLGVPPESIDMHTFAPNYMSPLARAQKMEEVTAMDQFEQALGQLMGVNQEIIDLYDFDEAARRRAELLDVPTKLIRNADDVKKLRRKREQAIAAQQAAMAEMGKE